MMKKMMMVLAVLLSLAMLAACAEGGQSVPASDSQEAASGASPALPAEETGESQPDSTPEKEEQPDVASSVPAQTPAPNDAESSPLDGDADSTGNVPADGEAGTSSQATETAPSSGTAASISYGAVPFELAAGTGKWWKIDSTDAAYWAVQENINAMRAEGGLPALTMDDALSTTASSRCESFVAGGPFDHSGMVTKSEICASGPLFSAADVCTAWQNSETHYANIMRSDITRMGVGCWFCEMDGSKYTYWTVTFE